MVITDDLAQGHTLFLAWLNDQLDTPTAAPPYAALVAELTQQTTAGETAKVVVLELYGADMSTLTGFLVVSVLNTDSSQRIFLFDDTGEPLAYNDGDSGPWLQVTPGGLVDGFTEGGTAALKAADNSPWGQVGLFTALLWGTRLPFLHVETVANVPNSEVGRALLDVYFPERGGGSYGVSIVPNTDANSYQVRNVSGQILDLTLPLFLNYTLKRRLEVGGVTKVPVTPNSSYNLEKLRQQGLVTYVHLDSLANDSLNIQ